MLKEFLINQPFTNKLSHTETILNSRFKSIELLLKKEIKDLVVLESSDKLKSKVNILFEGYSLKSLKDENQQQETKEELSTINFLFKFACEQSKGRTVSSMDWNSVNTDLLAASYGEADLSLDRDGYLMFWSLKNPNFPERIIKSPSSKNLSLCNKFLISPLQRL